MKSRVGETNPIENPAALVPFLLRLSQFESGQSTGLLRVLHFGDSHTAADEWTGMIRHLLQSRFGDGGTGFLLPGRPFLGYRRLDTKSTATTGWTTGDLSRALVQTGPLAPFDLVTLLIGVNNQYRGRSEAEYRQQFRSLLQRAITYAGDDATRVIVLSIPDWSVTPFAAGRDTKQIATDIDAESGSSTGRNFLANVSLTINTFGAVLRSLSVKSLPLSNGMPSVLK